MRAGLTAGECWHLRRSGPGDLRFGEDEATVTEELRDTANEDGESMRDGLGLHDWTVRHPVDRRQQGFCTQDDEGQTAGVIDDNI